MIQDFNLANSYVLEKLQGNVHSFAEFETEALENGIPIITPEVQRLLLFFLSQKQAKRVLEIGTAVGFSTTLIATAIKPFNGVVTTIEFDENRYLEAKKNFMKYGVASHVEAILGDACDVLPTLREKFDFIFIDATKSKYEYFFDESLKLLDAQGMIFIDNLMFKGSVFTDIKKYRSIGKNLNAFIERLMTLNCLVLPIGDGVGIYVAK